jgi:hypothetical protein
MRSEESLMPEAHFLAKYKVPVHGTWHHCHCISISVMESSCVVTAQLAIISSYRLITCWISLSWRSTV